MREIHCFLLKNIIKWWKHPTYFSFLQVTSILQSNVLLLVFIDHVCSQNWSNNKIAHCCHYKYESEQVPCCLVIEIIAPQLTKKHFLDSVCICLVQSRKAIYYCKNICLVHICLLFIYTHTFLKVSEAWSPQTGVLSKKEAQRDGSDGWVFSTCQHLFQFVPIYYTVPRQQRTGS